MVLRALNDDFLKIVTLGGHVTDEMYLAVESTDRGPSAPVEASGRGLVTDRHDISQWFDDHGAFLLRVVKRLHGDHSEAEDIVQETFVVAFRRRAELPADLPVRAWLYRVAVNLVRHQRRGLARRLAFRARLDSEVARSQKPEHERGLELAELAAQVRACVTRLPSRQREVFVLFELEGLEGHLIAELLGIPLNTVWTRLHHGRARFRTMWERAHKQQGTP